MPASNFFGAISQGLDFKNQQEQNKLARQQQFLQLDDQRKGAMFQDARTVNSFLKSGQPEQALNVLSNRMNLLEQIGGDTQDTREIADFIARGDTQGATNLLDSVELAGVQSGFLQDLTPKSQQFKNVESLPTGERVGVSGGVEQVIPATAEVKQARKDALKLKSDSNAFLKQEQQLKLLTEKAKLAKEESNKAKIDQEISKRSGELLKKQRAVKFEFDSAISNINDSSATIDRMLKGDNLESAAGFQANFPTVSGSGASDFESQLDTLQSQVFLAQVEKMKGLGALSENEGRKLAQAIGALSIDQSDDSLRSELIRIQDKFSEAKKRLTAKFGGKFTSEPAASDQSDQDLANALGL